MPTRFIFNHNLIQKSIFFSRITLYILALLSFSSLILNFIYFQTSGLYLHEIESVIIFVLAINVLFLDKDNSKKSFSVFLANLSLGLVLLFLLYFFLVIFNAAPLFGDKNKISFLSLVCFFLCTQSLILRKFEETRFLKASQLVSVITVLITISTILAYVFESNLLSLNLYFSTTTFSVAINLLFISTSMLMLKPSSGWMPVLFADNIGSRQLRKSTLFTFPVLAITAVVASFGIKHGFYNFQYAFNIITISSFVIFGFALLFTALSLNKNDREREIAIDELKQKEFDLMEAQKLAHVGSWTLELGSTTPKWSSEMYNIYGIPEGKPISLDVIESYFSVDDLMNIRSQMQKCIEHGTPVDIKHSFKRKDGTEKTVHGRAELRLNKVTGKKEVHGTLHDITEISTTLADLIETKKMYTDLYNEAPDMLLSVNPATGMILKCNYTLLKILGYEMNEVVGKHISNFYTQDSFERIPNLTESFIKTGSINNVELVVLRKDGTKIDVSLSSTLVRGKNGEIIKSRSIWRNISDVKMARELEIRKRAAEESSQMKSNFVATMSHEIRTPLNGVIGMSEVLMGTKLNSEQYDIVDTIKQSANTLFYLVNDILDFSKIESGKMELVPSYFSLRVLLLEIEKQLRWAAFKKELTISFVVTGGENLNFYGDRNRIQQILTNLISNAIKFTEKGSIDVNVSVLAETETISKISFEVNDTGIGISPSEQGLLFKPFYQSDSSLSRLSGGTGLGLSISQTLAELMGSRILIESQLGQGSKFYFDLRLQHETLSAQNFDIRANTFFKFDHSPRILVAEDIDTNRKVLGSMLSDFGCHCVFATNGEQAIEALKNDTFDLVLMDCQMPKMDGIEAVKQIRKLPNEKSKIPVVAVTAHAGSEDRKICIDAGMSDYISKPFTKGILNDILNKWLSLSPALPSQTATTSDMPRLNSMVDERILADLKSLTSVDSGDLIKDTVSIFEKNLPKRLDAIRQALRERNPIEAKNAVHTLKSAASAFGGSSITQICNSIIEEVKEDRFADALMKTEKITDEVKRVRDFINSWLLVQSS